MAKDYDDMDLRNPQNRNPARYKMMPPDSVEAAIAGKNYKLEKNFGVKGKASGKKSWKDSVSKEEMAKAEEYFKLKPGAGASWEDGGKKKPVKVTKKEVTVETPSGDIGSVDRTVDVINSAPDMSRTNMPAPVIESSSQAVKPYQNTDPAKVVDKDRTTWIDPMVQARRSMGFKKGGAVKKSTVSSASRRGDGCAQRGKTKGRMV
jgi:hypothetical protein